MKTTTLRGLGRVAAAGLLGALTALPASAASPIKVGLLLPSSGVFAGLGKDQDISFQMALEDFGDEVGGRKIVLVRADTESKPNSGLAAAKKLILRDRADVLVGVISSGVLGAVRDYVDGAKVPLIVTNAGNDDITGEKCSPWILRSSFSNDQIVREMGPWMARAGYKRVFLMAFDYAGGHQLMDSFRKGFVAAGGEIAGEEYPPLGETKDFGPYLAKLKAAEPDAAFVFFAGGPAIKFVKEYAAFGLKDTVKLAGPGWLTSALYVGKQGADAEGTLSILNYVPSIDSAENKGFQERFRAKHGRDASEFGVAAYDAARLVIEALQATGGATDDRQALVAAMHRVQFNGPRGPFRIDPATNNVIQNIYISEVEKIGDTYGAVVKEVRPNVQDAPNGCSKPF
ncbi:MAG: ABC transporter substrate-binding protein [Ectothiorhodospiraceae bacterium]|nr:ABC transporter substrate-binding protein [Chromatiales bacterium]MCP5155473.1 ABC transporter substrate-binding protein [Ectothiorhodospiraceae bacterium]